jgi:Transposase protein
MFLFFKGQSQESEQTSTIQFLRNEMNKDKQTISQKKSLIDLLSKQVQYYMQKCEELQAKNKILQQKCDSFSENLEDTVKTKVHQILSPVFTPGQIEFLQKRNKEIIQWSPEDLSKSIALFSVSNRAYIFLKDIYRFPLPALSTIYRHLQKINIKPGELMKPILQVLKKEFEVSSPMKKKCVFAMDEMAISEKFDIDEVDDKVYGGEKDVLVGCVRGLFYQYKQIVYYDFTGKIPLQKFYSMITSLHDSGLDIVLVVSDMGSKNQGFWRDLNLCRVRNGQVGKTKFPHPVTGENIWVMPDFPHLLKLLRNHVLDSGITLPTGAVLDKSVLENLLKIQMNSEFRLTHKLTQRHLEMHGKQRQNVLSAFQLFSLKVSSAIRVAFPDLHEIADFIEMINDFSDLLNVRTSIVNHHNVYKNAYGMNLNEHNSLLEKVNDTFKKIKVGKRKENSYAPFQKGFLILIQSLKGLFEDMTKSVNCKFIQTKNCNQDFVENCFSSTRGVSGFNMKPNAVEVKGRLKKVIMGWNFYKVIFFVGMLFLSLSVQRLWTHHVKCETYNIIYYT